jgi:hypothetical protein
MSMSLNGYRQAINDLWGEGYTLVRRHPDPFHIEQSLIPRGRSYQWNDTPDKEGWRTVPFSRHPGVFAPILYSDDGPIVVQGLYLCERPEVEVKDAHAAAAEKARKQSDDFWADRAKEFAGAGFPLSGSVRVGTQTQLGELDTLDEREFVTSRNTIETTVKVPRDMVPHMAAIFAERDRLESEIVLPDRTLKPGPIADKFYAAVNVSKGAPWWPTLLAILLPIAVDNVRKSLKETTNEPAGKPDCTSTDVGRSEAEDAGEARGDAGGEEPAKASD